MNAKLIMTTIKQLNSDIKNIKIIKDSKLKKYNLELENLYNEYSKIDIPETLKKQYNNLNYKGTQLIKEIKYDKNNDKLQNNIEVYIRYLKASLYDFTGNNILLRKYITSFLFSAILFLALSPQFYGFILPILFFLPIYLGLKGVKNRSISGFYMTMSLIPVAVMTSLTWIRYGINSIKDYAGSVQEIVKSGISNDLAQILVYIGPLFGCILFLFSCVQLYRGYKSKDLFI